MIYATRADIEQLYDEDFLTDMFEEGFDIDAAVADALARASAEIDAHLSVRYPLPLAARPQALVTPAINMAIYHLAIRHTHLTETIKDRYKDAIKLLERIADGKAGLGRDEPSVGGDPDASNGGALFTANPRLFSRRTLP